MQSHMRLMGIFNCYEAVHFISVTLHLSKLQGKYGVLWLFFRFKSESQPKMWVPRLL